MNIIVSEKNQLSEDFNQSWEIYESLFECLRNESVFYKKPQPLRHPLIFYYAHTASFYMNKLNAAKIIDQRINAEFDSLFAIGVDEMEWDEIYTEAHIWPSLSQVREYRQAVKKIVNEVIDSLGHPVDYSFDSDHWVILMCMHHEKIHIETSSVLIRQLDLDDVISNSSYRPCQSNNSKPIQNSLISVPGGVISLGKEKDSYYGWDNEYGSKQYKVDDFKASKYLVTNQEYLQFLEQGGYNSDEFWSAEGKRWKDKTQAKLPEFWVLKQGQYFLRQLTSEIKLPLNYPVEVCYHEASAYCNWLSQQQGHTIRLPDEFEYRRMLEVSGLDSQEALQSVKANWSLKQGASSCAVDINQHGDFFDLVGNVWQWNETAIFPFDSFEPHPLYEDFSLPTFDNKHQLIKGGSWISSGNLTSLTSRYAFRKHFYQHAGFRYIISDQEAYKTSDYYMDDEILAQYCEFHYGHQYFDVDNFPQKLVDILASYIRDDASGKALDLGCAVGRSSFELLQYYDQVDALDLSTRFLNVGIALQEQGEVRYLLKDEGVCYSEQKRYLTDIVTIPQGKKVNFRQQDASNLKPKYTNYDLIFAANLIDRLADPITFLQQIHQRINQGGLLLVASPFTWDENFTPKHRWLCEVDHLGNKKSSLESLKCLLSVNFEQLSPDLKVPFVIRETKNKFQHSLSQLSIWRKR